MDIVFPEFERLGAVDRRKLLGLLAMLDIDGIDWLRVRRYSLVLAEANEPFRYVGKAIQLNDASGSAMAIARQVYGQHMVSVLGVPVVRVLHDQAAWLAGEAQNLQNGNYQAVLLNLPRRGEVSVALAERRSTQISFVVTADAEGRFALQDVGEFKTRLAQEDKDRIGALELARVEFGGNFSGLPA